MGRRAIVIEDDPALRRLLELALGRIGGWSVQLAESFDAAMALETQQLDVYLVDVMLGEDDGRTILRYFDESKLTRAPFLFVTALVNASARAEYDALGAIGVIEKPFDPMKVAAQVEAMLLAHWARAQHRP